MNISTKPTIFVCEFITAGGLLGQALPESLVTEGLLMRDALIHDLQACATVITTHDSRIIAPQSCRSIVLKAGDDANAVWFECMQQAEYVWLIAPETDQILLYLTKLAKESGATVIGCSVDAIAITSSKIHTHRHLSAHAIPTIHTEAYTQAELGAGRYVLKLDDGVGCESIHIGDAQSLKQAIQAYENLDEKLHEKLIVQPYINGQSASAVVMSFAGQSQVLSYNAQMIQNSDGQLMFKGVLLNHMQLYQSAIDTIVTQISKALPDLQGFWGVDLLIDRETGEVTVVEINPRLTTAYNKLSEAMGCNPAQWLLESMVDGKWHQQAFQYNKVACHV